jgi:hypothetical protein
VLGLPAWDVMRALLACATGGYAVGYVIVCFAAPAFLLRIGEMTVRPVIVAIAGGGLVAASFVVYLLDLVSGPMTGAAMLFGGAVVSVAAVLFVSDRRRSHRRGPIVFAYDVPTRADVLGGENTTEGTSGERPRW